MTALRDNTRQLSSPQWLHRTALAALLSLGVFTLSGCVGSDDIRKNEALFKAPEMNQDYKQDDFQFPSTPPSLVKGKEVFQANCASCHAASYWQQPKVQADLAYTTPIDYYLMLTNGDAPEVAYPSEERHQMQPQVHKNAATGEKLVYRDTLVPDQRWAVLFYTRHLAGMDDLAFANQKGEELKVGADMFGGNCAVCHGNTGHAEGFLHTGKPSKHGPEGGKVHEGLFEPPPANFHDYKRMYNRTDAQLHRYVSQGIYPSAMPRWYGRVDKDKSFAFNDEAIWKLVRYVRQYSYKVDLPDTDGTPKGALINTHNEKWYRPQSGTDLGFTGNPSASIPTAVEGAAVSAPAADSSSSHAAGGH